MVVEFIRHGLSHGTCILFEKNETQGYESKLVVRQAVTKSQHLCYRQSVLSFSLKRPYNAVVNEQGKQRMTNPLIQTDWALGEDSQRGREFCFLKK